MKIIELNYKQYNNIIFCGDVHGLLNLKSVLIDYIKDISDTLIIVLGDIGVGFSSPAIEKNIIKDCNEILKKSNNQLILFRGNHDNPYYFYENSEYNQDNVKLIRDYTILNTKNNNILCIGGGISIDRTNRLLNRTYWLNENILPLTDNLMNDIINLNYNIDIIATHNAPLFIPPINKSIDEEGYMVESWSFYDKELKKDVWNDRYVLNNLYEFIIKYHNIKYWFYGHFHNMYKTIYNDITFIGLDMYYKHIKTVKYSLEKSIVKYGPDLYNLYDENKFTNLKEIKN